MSAASSAAFTIYAMLAAKLNEWLHHPIRIEDVRHYLRRWWFLKRAISWHDRLLAGVLACLLPFLALGIEWCLTWQNQRSLVGHFGLPDFTNLFGFMAIPAVISFLVLLPFLRYPFRSRVVATGLCLAWIAVLLSGEAGVR